VKLFTLGHGSLMADVFSTTLRAAGVTVAADVRRFAGSGRHPQFGAAEMRGWLGGAGIVYRALPELGGRRTPLPDSPNLGLRNAGFRGYADHMTTPAFRAAFEELIALARERPTAIFCAETLWWQCHRRLIADAAVLLAGFEVVHLTPATRAGHVLTPGVQRIGDVLRYPAAGADSTRGSTASEG
jgi:uncharacterized protein (DUF488 family)